MRPVHDGVLITSTLDSSSSFPQVSKPIILSTVVNEAGPAIYSLFPAPIGPYTYEGFVYSSFTEPEASNLLAYPEYQVPTLTGGQTADARIQLEQMGTDQIWRCPTWTFARSYCSGAGVVCHEDDIEIVVRDLFDFPRPYSTEKCSLAQFQILLQPSPL